jgi:hypothetical protein
MGCSRLKVSVTQAGRPVCWLGRTVTYFCLIESKILAASSMEQLEANTLEEALYEAAELMRVHGDPLVVHVFSGEDYVQSILADPP